MRHRTNIFWLFILFLLIPTTFAYPEDNPKLEYKRFQLLASCMPMRAFVHIGKGADVLKPMKEQMLAIMEKSLRAINLYADPGSPNHILSLNVIGDGHVIGDGPDCVYMDLGYSKYLRDPESGLTRLSPTWRQSFLSKLPSPQDNNDLIRIGIEAMVLRFLTQYIRVNGETCRIKLPPGIPDRFKEEE